MDDEALLDTSNDESTIRETPLEQQRDSPTTFSRHLVNRFGIIGHHNISSEAVSQPENPRDYGI